MSVSKTPNYNTKVKKILDPLSRELQRAGGKLERVCELTGETWEMTEEEISWYKKFNVPPSPYAPRVSWLWTNFFGTGYQWWWNKHADTGKPVLSYHHPAAGYHVLPEKEWYAKDFSHLTLEYNPDQPFFEQFEPFLKQLPFPASGSLMEPENSVSLISLGDKNSYFVLGCRSKNSFYSILNIDGEDSSEIWTSQNVSSCYNIVNSKNLHQCRFVRESFDCINSDFLFDCRNCESCFGASNKRNKKYLWFNEQLSKEEWEQRRASVNLASRKELSTWLAKFDELLHEDTYWPEAFNEKAENCIGDYLQNAVDCHYCVDIKENCRGNFWCYVGNGASEGNAMCVGIVNSTDCYFSQTPSRSRNVKFGLRVKDCDSCEYCVYTEGCSDCFGCIGLRNKSFCIFNVQYTEDAYWKKLDEVKCNMLERGEYATFFPFSMSTTYIPYSWATTFAQATAEELQQFGGRVFGVCDAGACGPEGEDASTMRKASEIPDDISELGDDWAGVPVFDEAFGRKFSFLKPELAFYRRQGIAPPNEHFIKRVLDLVKTGQVGVFEHRSCAACNKELVVTMNQRYPERKILCREDYLQHIEQHG